MVHRIAQVALPVGLRRTLSYEVPEALDGGLQPGHRVRVPLRGRQTHGYVVGWATDEERRERRLKEILAIEPAEPLLRGHLLEVALWAADYYLSPVGEMIEAALPAQVWKGRARRASSPDAPPEPDVAPTPTAAQDAAVEAIMASRLGRRDAPEGDRPAVFLLHGVTGSGKTEVYLRLASLMLEQGLGTLVLVPEIALGAQLVDRFRRRLGARVGIFHSGMPEGQRRNTWWRAREGEIQVVVGTRSAVFIPLPRLGAVVVDEEHEPAYKQSESPRYHGRDVALVRARLEGAVAVLGSATPSLESRRHVDGGKYRLATLPDRVEKRPQAQVILADLRPLREDRTGVGPSRPAPRRTEGGIDVLRQPRVPGHVFSPLLLDRIETCLSRLEQAILFLNRRGHSTSVQCDACGHVFRCPDCSVILTFHRTGGVLRCHYCGHIERNLAECPECFGRNFLFGGFGTQKVEAQIRERFPEARIQRMDLDTTRRRGAHERIIRDFEQGALDILVGTQMVGKGLDFPGVTLVGVLLADREMAIPDFRGQERAFQILTQVAGRAGRGDRPGEVVFQTFMPDHFVIQTAARQDYETFYRAESEERRQLGFPPFERIAHLLLDDPKEPRVIRQAEALREHLDRLPQIAAGPVRLFGPAPMSIERLKGRYRWHLTLSCPSSKALRSTLLQAVAWHEGRKSSVRLMVDVDPLHGF